MPHARSLRLARLGLAACLALMTSAATARADLEDWFDKPLSRWFAARNAPQADPSSGNTAADDKNPGLVSKWLTGEKTPFTSGKYGSNSVLMGDKGWQKVQAGSDPAAEAEFAAAKKVFDAKDYPRAETILSKLAAREIKKVSPVGEKAQFYLAETQFLRQKYVAAHDSFEILKKKYNSPEQLDKLVQREYQIAQIWLAHEDPKAKPLPWQARFDGRKPFLDGDSAAIKALEHVRNNDATGPLADDAVLRMADHYHLVGDYESAALYYDQLAAEHNKSEYKERAMRSSIDSKMKGYQGPEYDVSGLEAAQKTIRQTLAEFPESAAYAEQLYHTSDLIQDAEAEREYNFGLYYVRARKPISAEYQFGLVMHQWPKSKWAKLAKNQMAVIAKAPRKASQPSKIMTLPGAPDPNQNQGGQGLGGMLGGMGGMGGMGGGGGAGGSPY